MLLDRSAMSCASQGWVFIAVLLSGLGAGGSSAFAQERGGRWYDLEHLTGPSTRDPAQTYRRYLERNRDRMGMTNVDLDKLVVRNRYISSRTGTTHLYMRQQIHGIPVEGTDRVAAVDRRGRLLSQHGRPAWAVASKPVLTRRPGLSASAATQWAALGLGLNGSADIQVLKRHQGATQATDLSADDLSQDDIPAKLAYLISEEDRLQRTWNIVLRPIDGRHWWNLFVDAETGEILRREDWMHHDTYNVFPSPLQSALDGARVLTTDAADAKASPFGWHDTDGVAGAEFNDTQGNNVRAQEDSDGDNFGGLRPDGGAARTFDSPVDLSAHPSNYQDAAVTNLFYWANFLHDVLYHNGFDEAAGNFQEKNYGLGGVGGDALRADAQDGAETNNAQFGAPIDGFSPRMEMFLFVRGPGPALQVQAPAGIAGAYPASDGSFGGETNGLTGDVVLALDDPNSAGPTTTDACSPLTNTLEIAGKVALVDRGVCLFIEKVATAQTAGAIGIIIANNAGNGLVNMSGDGRGLSIPAIFIGQSDGALLKGELANGLRVTLTTDRHRDSSFDNGIVIHEYGHGLTNRLTGGPFNSGCLDVAQSEGMGEGCDWLALVLTARTTDHVLDRRTVGNFSLRQSANGPGLRSHPYSRDLSINPLSFADISTLPQPHGIGEVWAATLWDLYWGFVGEYGFDPNFYSGSGGNNRLLQLVIDALKLQTCDPTFVQARDAILTADLNGSQGVNHCLIWESFARRGIGASALAGASNGTTVTEAFDLPLNCQTQCGDRARQPGEQCDDGNAADFDGCTATCRFETALPRLSGVALGGTVSTSVAGIPFEITTTAGQSGAEVATALRAAIISSTALHALGVSATAANGRVAVGGQVGSLNVSDAGLRLGGDAQARLLGNAILSKGLNVLGVPIDPIEIPNTESVLRSIEPSIEAISIRAAVSQSLVPCQLDDTGGAEGTGCPHPAAPGEAWLVDVLSAGSIPYNVALACPDYELTEGLQLLSFPCGVTGLTASELLDALFATGTPGTVQSFG